VQGNIEIEIKQSIKTNMGRYFITVLLMTSLAGQAQHTVYTLEKCYTLARQNYPLIKKHDLIARTSNYSIENAGKGWLPQFSVSGQASYQSQTIDFQKAIGGGPGLLIPPLSKDQYKIQAEVDQNIFDGGRIKNEKDMILANEASQQQNLEIALYQLNDRINQLYFSILLIDEQIRQNDISKSNFQSAADQAKAAYNNGTAFKSNVDEFLAEIASIELVNIDFRANRKAYLDMLSVFIGQRLDEKTELLMPPQILPDPVIKRPEIALYDLNKIIYDVQEKQLKTAYLPRFDAFIQGAYGRPTLNFIDDNFGGWYVGGVRMIWNLGSLYTLKNNRTNIRLNKESVDVDKETFIYNTNLSLSKQGQDLIKYSSLIKQDETIISLRSSVASAAKAQLENGVVTVHDYIAKSNDENLAKQSKILHSIQLIQAQYQYKNTSGN
jgi:outer membrane protein TolC